MGNYSMRNSADATLRNYRRAAIEDVPQYAQGSLMVPGQQLGAQARIPGREAQLRDTHYAVMRDQRQAALEQQRMGMQDQAMRDEQIRQWARLALSKDQNAFNNQMSLRNAAIDEQQIQRRNEVDQYNMGMERWSAIEGIKAREAAIKKEEERYQQARQDAREAGQFRGSEEQRAAHDKEVERIGKQRNNYIADMLPTLPKAEDTAFNGDAAAWRKAYREAYDEIIRSADEKYPAPQMPQYEQQGNAQGQQPGRPAIPTQPQQGQPGQPQTQQGNPQQQVQQRQQGQAVNDTQAEARNAYINENMKRVAGMNQADAQTYMEALLAKANQLYPPPAAAGSGLRGQALSSRGQNDGGIRAASTDAGLSRDANNRPQDSQSRVDVPSRKEYIAAMVKQAPKPKTEREAAALWSAFSEDYDKKYPQPAPPPPQTRAQAIMSQPFDPSRSAAEQMHEREAALEISAEKDAYEKSGPQKIPFETNRAIKILQEKVSRGGASLSEIEALKSIEAKYGLEHTKSLDEQPQLTQFAPSGSWRWVTGR